MRRYELYVDNNDKLVVSEFRTIESEYESRIFRGSETYEVLRNLASFNILDICEYKKRNDVLLEYKNYIINISDYDEVFVKRGTAPLLRNIKDYSERRSLSECRSKKVKRKNKYSAKKIIASGIAIILIGACANNLLNNESNAYNSYDNYVDKPVNQVQMNDDVIKLSNNYEGYDDIEKDISYDKEIINISLNYEDRSDTEKACITKSYYSELIEKYARMYGIDPALVTAVATQESLTGIHTTKTDVGGATGLMQIQNEVWIGNDVSAYNFETKRNETLEVTLNKIQDVEYNVKIGCMILQNSLEYMNYNPLAALQCYNMGYGNMMKILNAYSKDSNKNIDKILSDINDTNWLDYRSIIKVGDQKYIENVLSWIGEEVNIKNVKKDGSLVTLNIGNQLDSKKVY